MQLAPLCEGLEALNASVAEQFLALAGGLQSNSIHARQIAVESRKAIGSEASLQNGNSIAMLKRILAETAGISGMVEISTEQMLDILSRVNAARAPLRNLGKVRCLLQSIGVLSRIESRRITNTLVDLSSLSRDIDVLAEEIQQHLDRFCEDSSTLYEALQNGVRQLSRFGQQERVHAAHLIRQTQSVLEPMVARSEASMAAARDIDEQYTSFHRATDRVVMSLQSEDIARQRVEHVLEAIRRVATSLDSGASVESCAGILAMQRSQLVSTRELLVDSIGTIQSALQSLSPRIRDLVSRTAELSEQTDENGRSFASIIDNGLETVSAVFEQCSSSVKAVLAIVNSVIPQAGNMTSGAGELEKIESSLHLMSLNASVKAEHLGSEGVAMGVIASELHSVTKVSEVDTRTVLDGLAAINNSLAKVTREGVEAERSVMMTSSSDAVRCEFDGLSSSVKTSCEQMVAGLNHVRQMAEELCLELEHGCRLAGESSITELFDEQLRNFDEVFRKIGYAKDMTVGRDSGNEADDLSKLYSMESERKLHMEIFGGNTSAGENPEASEFGDDVELF
jgi:hypothetical protein